jgi:hypothetical protein
MVPPLGRQWGETAGRQPFGLEEFRRGPKSLNWSCIV